MSLGFSNEFKDMDNTSDLSKSRCGGVVSKKKIERLKLKLVDASSSMVAKESGEKGL
jgi:hypothetical protein